MAARGATCTRESRIVRTGGSVILTKEVVGPLAAAVVVLETSAIKEGETSMAAGGSREGAEGDSMEGVVVTGVEGEVVSKSLAVR